MSSLRITLSTKFTSIPAHCKVYCSENLIFNSVVAEETTILHNFRYDQPLNIKIIKSGKTLDIVKKGHEQTIQIKEIILNGIKLKSKELGIFKIKNNPYVEDNNLSTDNLSLNGEWELTLPFHPLVGYIDLKSIKTKIRDQFGDCHIACFGCSQTFGHALKYEESWPYVLGKLLNANVKNFGVSGSNINEMTAFIEEYLNCGYKTNVIIMLVPHTFRRQIQNKDLNVVNIQPYKLDKEIFIHGEEHSVATMSGALQDWFNSFNKVKFLVGAYQITEHDLFKQSSLKKNLLPFLDYHKYPKASDGKHFGSLYNELYAKSIQNFLNKNNIDFL